jgi:hypothetical protein
LFLITFFHIYFYSNWKFVSGFLLHCDIFFVKYRSTCSLLCFVNFFFVFNRLLWRTWGTVETIWHEHGIWAVSWDVSACTLGACSTFRSKPTEWIWGTVEGWNGSIRMLVGWSRLEVLVLCFGVTMEANVWLQVVLLICSVLFSLWLC